jgi:glutaredoxin
MILSWFPNWFEAIRPRRRHRMSVQMVTRRGCHLCETAWATLQKAAKTYGFHLSALDVDSDPKLAAQYSNDVPVILIDGKVRFRGIVSEVLLHRLLRGSPPS